MPNYVDITLSLLGKDQDLGRFTRQAEGARKPTGDQPYFPNGTKNLNYDCATNPPRSVFEFDRLIPLPESYSQQPYSSHGYNLECETWGIKWGAFDHKPPKFEEGCATYQFRCAWDAPRFFLCKVSLLWPGLWFLVSYGGEGPIRGRLALRNGIYLEDVDDDGDDAPHSRDYDDEEEWSAQLDQWTDAYRDSHQEYVRQFVEKHILGLDDDPENCTTMVQ